MQDTLILKQFILTPDDTLRTTSDKRNTDLKTTALGYERFAAKCDNSKINSCLCKFLRTNYALTVNRQSDLVLSLKT
jgi:hypothetical protein